jgi:hypothetical protein
MIDLNYRISKISINKTNVAFWLTKYLLKSILHEKKILMESMAIEKTKLEDSQGQEKNPHMFKGSVKLTMAIGTTKGKENGSCCRMKSS